MLTSEKTAHNSFEDFTISHYRTILKTAKENFIFRSYRELFQFEQGIVWRHDGDFSLNRCLKIAKIEKDSDIKATYFLNLHSEFYNLMEREQFQIVQQILALGHSVGIHLDLAFYNPITTTELCDAIELEISFFKNHLGVEPEVFSFHNPTQFALTTFVEDTYCNLVNCYSQTFWQKVAYCSDSNGYWRFKRLLDFLKNNTASHLQVLTHPGMWQDTPLAPMERILRCIHGRSANVLDIYYETLQSSGRMNLGGPLEDFEFLKALDPQLHMTLQLLLLHKKYSQLAVIFLNLHFEWLVEFTSIPTSQTENIQNISKQFYNQYNVSWLDICQTNLAEYNTNAGKTHNTHETHIYRYFLHISKLLFIWHSESYNAKNV